MRNSSNSFMPIIMKLYSSYSTNCILETHVLLWESALNSAFVELVHVVGVGPVCGTVPVCEKRRDGDAGAPT